MAFPADGDGACSMVPPRAALYLGAGGAAQISRTAGVSRASALYFRVFRLTSWGEPIMLPHIMGASGLSGPDIVKQVLFQLGRTRSP